MGFMESWGENYYNIFILSLRFPLKSVFFLTRILCSDDTLTLTWFLLKGGETKAANYFQMPCSSSAVLKGAANFVSIS